MGQNHVVVAPEQVALPVVDPVAVIAARKKTLRFTRNSTLIILFCYLFFWISASDTFEAMKSNAPASFSFWFVSCVLYGVEALFMMVAAEIVTI